MPDLSAAFYLRRAEQEREAADMAADRSSRRAHQELALRYEALARNMETIQIVVETN